MNVHIHVYVQSCLIKSNLINYNMLYTLKKGATTNYEYTKTLQYMYAYSYCIPLLLGYSPRQIVTRVRHQLGGTKKKRRKKAF